MLKLCTDFSIMSLEALHEISACHAVVVEAIVTLKSTTISFSIRQTFQKWNNRHTLHEILLSGHHISALGYRFFGSA